MRLDDDPFLEWRPPIFSGASCYVVSGRGFQTFVEGRTMKFMDNKHLSKLLTADFTTQKGQATLDKHQNPCILKKPQSPMKFILLGDSAAVT